MSLATVEVGPPDATRAVVWLHGLGADGHDFEPIVAWLGLPDVRFVFPHAPVRPLTIHRGFAARAWYDLRTLEESPDREDEGHIREAAAAIEALLRREHARGVPWGRLVLAGFSQGGAMALHVGHRFPHRLAGLLALSTYRVLEAVWEAEGSPANQDTPALVCHGVHDTVVPVARGRRAYDALARPGRDVRWRTFPMDHGLHDDQVPLIAGWLREVLDQREDSQSAAAAQAASASSETS